MVNDLDIYRSAKILIDQHGDDAGLEAAVRADAMLEHGDMAGAKTWRAIVKAVEELRRAAPEPGGYGTLSTACKTMPASPASAM